MLGRSSGRVNASLKLDAIELDVRSMRSSSSAPWIPSLEKEHGKIFLLPPNIVLNELLIELRPLQLRFRLISGEKPHPVTGA